jgi:protein suppressor of PHYA-105 1
LINGGQDFSLLDEAPVSIGEDDTESSLLLNFLSQLKEEKAMQSAKLSAELGSLQTDITEVDKRHSTRMRLSLDDTDVLPSSSALSRASVSALQGALLSGLLPASYKSSIYEERVMRNLVQLENAYYSMRSSLDTCETNVIKQPDISCRSGSS